MSSLVFITTAHLFACGPLLINMVAECVGEQLVLKTNKQAVFFGTDR